jgi:alanine racemase
MRATAAEVWAEIDLSAIEQNVEVIRSYLAPKTRLMAVVKADAYGHGLLPVARKALASGADFFGVARLCEAVALRKGGITAPILVFGYTPPGFTDVLAANGISQTVYSYETARLMAEEALKAGRSVPVHIKTDTGMGRLGIAAANPGAETGAEEQTAAAIAEIEAISRLEGLFIEGTFTHFATADQADKSFARAQFRAFQEVLEGLAERGVPCGIRHAANSAAAIEMADTHLDMVRAGISLYGLPPSEHFNGKRIGLRPAMALKARIIHLKSVGEGFFVSYGATAKTEKPTVLATVAIGYADGYSRALSSRGRMLVRGCPAPVVGRVCMDQTVIDVGHVPGVCLGDEALVFGGDAGGEVPVMEIARLLDTISYEVVTGVSGRVPRLYRERGAET